MSKPASEHGSEPVLITSQCSLKIHLNVIPLPSTSHLPSGHLPISFLTKILYAFFVCPIPATCPAHPVSHYHIPEEVDLSLRHRESLKSRTFC